VVRIVEMIKFLMLPSNRLLMTSRLATVGRACRRKHIRGNTRYFVTWNTWRFSVGYFSILDKSERHIERQLRNIGQGETPHRNNKRLKLGGGHLYNRSNV
jgi:hypothetical protein